MSHEPAKPMCDRCGVPGHYVRVSVRLEAEGTRFRLCWRCLGDLVEFLRAKPPVGAAP
jgi:hypothetical protein